MLVFYLRMVARCLCRRQTNSLTHCERSKPLARIGRSLAVAASQTGPTTSLTHAARSPIFPAQNIQASSELTAMANPEHLEILKRGVKAWNEWRRKPLQLFKLSDRSDLSSAELSDSDLNDINLSRVDLSHANLSRANLSGANLTRAYLNNTPLLCNPLRCRPR
jgi:Pentapeptide repeats (8 copies)